MDGTVPPVRILSRSLRARANTSDDRSTKAYTKIYVSDDPIACTHAMLYAFRRPAVKVDRVAARGQWPGIVLAVRTSRGDRETQEYETRCPSGGGYTGFVCTCERGTESCPEIEPAVSSAGSRRRR